MDPHVTSYYRSLYFALCGRLFVYGGYWTTKRDRQAAVYRERSTKRGLALYTVTVNRVYDSKLSLGVTPKTTEQNRIVRTGKSEAEVKTRGQSNLTKSASRGAHSPIRDHPRGSKFVPLNSWGRGS